MAELCHVNCLHATGPQPQNTGLVVHSMAPLNNVQHTTAPLLTPVATSMQLLPPAASRKRKRSCPILSPETRSECLTPAPEPCYRHVVTSHTRSLHTHAHRRAIAPQYIEQLRIALSIFKASVPTVQRDCPSMPSPQARPWATWEMYTTPLMYSPTKAQRTGGCQI